MSKVDEILEIQTNKFKAKSYKELGELVDSVYGFKEKYKGQSFIFEIHVIKVGDELKIMVEVARDKFFLGLFGKAKYFSVDSKGNVGNTEAF